eukprot:1303653-Prymnesium_polylepis.1
MACASCWRPSPMSCTGSHDCFHGLPRVQRRSALCTLAGHLIVCRLPCKLTPEHVVHAPSLQADLAIVSKRGVQIPHVTFVIQLYL